MFSELKRQETIYALSTGAGKSAVAIVRVSGPKSKAIIQSLIKGRIEPRVARLTEIIDPDTFEIVDRGLVLWFPAPNSFTGEDCLEFQLHGSRAVVAKIYRILEQIAGVRLAEPGEFTQRALKNGKLDLIGVEALGDLIDAETEAQRSLAIRQMGGELSAFAEHLRGAIIQILADIEIDLDFVDEIEDATSIANRIQFELESVEDELAAIEASYASVERVRDGVTVLISGRPNSGKSSLLNALARREVAIVSEFAGTTRDLIEVRLDLGGLPVNLVDTAGIRQSDDPIECEGVKRAMEKAESADLVLWLSPMNEAISPPPPELSKGATWMILTKADLEGVADVIPARDEALLKVSVRSAHQIDVLIGALRDFAESRTSISNSAIVANERQRLALSAARDAIRVARQPGIPLEIVAEELRRACFAMESLLGKIGVEDILDSLFARFCIGK